MKADLKDLNLESMSCQVLMYYLHYVGHIWRCTTKIQMNKLVSIKSET